MEQNTINKLKKIIKECVREELDTYFSKKERPEQNFEKEIKHGVNLYNSVNSYEEKKFSKNSKLNDILNETYNMDKTLKFTTNNVVTGNNQDLVGVDPVTKDALTRDYSQLMKAINKK